MSSDKRLKRLGLDHLKDNPEALKKFLDQSVEEDYQQEFTEQLKALEAIKEQEITEEYRNLIEEKIKKLKNQYRKPDDAGTNNI